MTIMRLRCPCPRNRNLADVTETDYNCDWVCPINHYAPREWRSNAVYLLVTPRIKRRSTGPRVVGVSPDQREYQPPGATMERTYSWQCWCGQNWQRTAKKIALAWDALIPLGSGQGIAHSFAHRERGEGVVRHADSAVFILEEIDHLVGLTGQTGSTLLPELRRVWMGERLGHLFVDPNKRLEIEQHTYRAGLIAGVQPGRAGVLLNDSEGGTPQRFLWLPATYPHPDQRPDEPKIRHWTPPQWKNDPHPPTDPQGPALPVIPRVTLPIPDCAKTEIDAALLARAKGQVDALDGHRLLCQLKVAAALGILDRRCVVSKRTGS